MATRKKAAKPRKRGISEDRFTASPTNIQNLRWAPGYGPKAKKKGK